MMMGLGGRWRHLWLRLAFALTWGCWPGRFRVMFIDHIRIFAKAGKGAARNLLFV